MNPPPKHPGRVKILVMHTPVLAAAVMAFFLPGQVGPVVIGGVVLLQAALSLWLYYNYWKRDRYVMRSLERMVVNIENGDWDRLKTYDEGMIAGLQQAIYEQLMQTRHHESSMRKQREYMKDFISHISHQMKTPLAALTMYVELMEDENMQPEVRADFIKRSDQQLDRLKWLIQSLLQIAKLEADSILLDKRDIPLGHIIECAAEDLDIIANEKGVEIDWSDDCSDTAIALDEKWMVQALENIVKNALEHTPEGGRVRIWTAQNRFTISLYVEDNGVGMDKEQIAKVFEPFYSRKQDDVSVGLGLALAKAIVVKHGGQIFVRSTKGEGTRFEIVFDKQ